MTDAAPTPPGLTYDHALSRIPGKWRGILAILSFVAGFLVISTVIGGVGLVYELFTGRVTPESLASGVVPLTPAIMFTNNLSLAACIPLAILLQRAFFGVKAGFLASVTGAFRWRWLGRLALIIVPVWLVYIGGSIALDPSGDWRIDGGVILMLAIVVITTPLQAAGEEYGARGLILRSAGSWFTNRWAAFIVGTVISGAIFAAAHAASDPWLIAYYFLFGVSGAIAARGTGGLEAPILIHATNNVLAFIPAVLLGQLEQGIDRSEGTGGPYILLPMVICLGAAFVSIWWGRRNKLVTRADAPPSVVLERLRARRAHSFGSQAAAYDALRPGYPDAALAWLVPVAAHDVLDLGAGTGKLTQSLVARGLAVTAVDPDFGMLTHLGAKLPTVRALPGSAEQIPLPDDSVDAVVVAQAWHWVNPALAAPEVARVLRPGGTLGLVWNILDGSVEWTKALGAAVRGSTPSHRPDAGIADDAVFSPDFGEVERESFPWEYELDRSGLLGLITTWSEYITATPGEQRSIRKRVENLLDTAPELAGLTVYRLPYIAHAFRARTVR